MNKKLSLLTGMILSCTMSASAFAGGFADDAQTSSSQAQIAALTQRIEKLSLSLSGNKVSPGSNYNLSESADTFDQGLVHFDDEGGVLFENLPDTTFEVELLRNRSHYAQRSVVLGGYLKVAAQRWGGDDIVVSGGSTLKSGGSGVYWLASMLDVYGAPNEWVAGYASFKATNAATDNDRTSQALSLSKAFVSVGNLDENPLFALIGKTHLPFGVFAGGGPLSPSVTRSAFKPGTTNQVWVGFDNKTFNSNLAIFQNSTDQKVSNFVLSFFLTKKPSELAEYTFGMGYLNDARGTDSGLGQALTTSHRLKSNRLALYDFNAAVSYGPVAFHAEFIKSFRPVTVDTALAGLTTTNTRLGHPQSWYLSTDYTAMIMQQLTIFSLGYSTSKHTEGVMQPIVSNVGGDLNSYYGLKNVWVASATRELAHNFFVALEYQRAKSYAQESTNTVSFDLNYYF